MPGIVVPPVCWRRILPPVALLVLVLLATASAYGYERDELYFRMLPPSWGHIDTPPLAPLIVSAAALVADDVWTARILSALIAGGSVLIVALITRELGGGRLAQTLAAWGYGFGTFTLVFGHSFIGGTIELVVWPGVALSALRALRRDPRWWLAAGAIAGIGLLNKLTVVVLLGGLALGLLLTGPRSAFRSRWVWAGVGLALLIAGPEIAYQLTNGLPQLKVGGALARRLGPTSRLTSIPLLAILLSPAATPVWIAGIIAPFRVAGLRIARMFVVLLLVTVVFGVAAGAQVYYPFGALSTVFAVGCIPVAQWAGTRIRRRAVGIAFGAMAVVATIIALPVVPLELLGRTPIPDINLAAADQVGWPALASTIDEAGAGSDDSTIVITANYGEAGAIARYSSRFSHRVWSGHNDLGRLPPPAHEPAEVILVGDAAPRSLFSRCRVAARLDDGVGVDNQEQGTPVRTCTGLREPISRILVAARHLD